MSNKEMELVIIAKIGDFEGLKEAEQVIEQSQLETFQEGKGRFRVRKSVDEEGTRYEVCVKSIQKTPSLIKTVDECEELISEAFFEAYRKMADTLRVKKRFVFKGEKSLFTKSDGSEVPLPAVTYEVDVFERHDGQQSEWCKIDIELNQIKEALASLDIEVGESDYPELFVKITHLPFKPQNAFMVGIATPEQMKKLSTLWDTEWTQNPLGGPIKPVEASVDQTPSEDHTANEQTGENTSEVPPDNSEQPQDTDKNKADDEQPNNESI